MIFPFTSGMHKHFGQIYPHTISYSSCKTSNLYVHFIQPYHMNYFEIYYYILLFVCSKIQHKHDHSGFNIICQPLAAVVHGLKHAEDESLRDPTTSTNLRRVVGHKTCDIATDINIWRLNFLDRISCSCCSENIT